MGHRMLAERLLLSPAQLLHSHERIRLPRQFHHVATPSASPFRILFLGRDEFSCLVLEQLHHATDVWEQLSIVTQPDVKTGRRSSKLSISPIRILSERLSLPVHFIPPDKKAFRSWQPPSPFCLSPDVPPLPSHVIITASFGHILPSSLLRLFQPSRRLNVHPSLLPAYRGAAPIQHALLDGQKETGVSIIEMMERKKGIDAGAVWAQKRMNIPDGAAFPALRDTLAREGGQLLVSVLRDMLSGKATSLTQPEEHATSRAPVITAEDAVIDFSVMSAEHVVRRYRAISHQRPLFAYLKTKATLQFHSPLVFTAPSDMQDLLPTSGTAIYHRPAEALLVRCADDSILAVPQVKQQDRALLKAKEWWNGVKPEMRMFEGVGGPIEFLRPDAVQL